MKILSHLFSWVFLPLFMPTYGILISLFVPAYSSDVEMTSLYFAPIESKWALFTIFFLFSVVAPGVSFILLHRFKVISTIDIERQRERSLPLLSCWFTHWFCFFCSFTKRVPELCRAIFMRYRYLALRSLAFF